VVKRSTVQFTYRAVERSTVYLPRGREEYSLLTKRWRGVQVPYPAVERSTDYLQSGGERVLFTYRAVERSTVYLPSGGEEYNLLYARLR
jgi:hypothetical protein